MHYRSRASDAITAPHQHQLIKQETHDLPHDTAIQAGYHRPYQPASKQEAAVSPPSKQAGPKWPAPPAPSSTPLLSSPSSSLVGMPSHPGALPGTSSHPYQEAFTLCNPRHAMTTPLPSSDTLPPPVNASLSPPIALPGPPARPSALPSLPGPPPRPSPRLGARPGPALRSQQQASFNPKDAALDFFSAEFDAMKALYTRGLQPPIPRVKVLDNVVKCRLILPPELPESWSAWNAAHPKTEPSEVFD